MKNQSLYIGIALGFMLAMAVTTWSANDAAAESRVPTETHGIIASAIHGQRSLDNEFTDCKNKLLRVREVVVAPGGELGVHTHESRPEVAYVLEGQMTEHRDGKPPTVQLAGTTLFAMNGTTHWLRNDGTEPVRALTIDIVEAQE